MSAEDKQYYRFELGRVKALETGYPISVKFVSDLGESRNLNLNLDSIQVIREFLDLVEGEIKRESEEVK